MRSAAAGEFPGVDHLWRRLWCARCASIPLGTIPLPVVTSINGESISACLRHPEVRLEGKIIVLFGDYKGSSFEFSSGWLFDGACQLEASHPHSNLLELLQECMQRSWLRGAALPPGEEHT